MLFAVLAVLVTAVSAWVAYGRVRSALESEFERRLARVAATAASQIEPELIHEVRARGEESAGYLSVQVQLVTLRSATGVDDASLIDSTRATLVDARCRGGQSGLRKGMHRLLQQLLLLRQREVHGSAS